MSGATARSAFALLHFPFLSPVTIHLLRRDVHRGRNFGLASFSFMRTFLVISWFVFVGCVSHAQTGTVVSPNYDFGVVKQGERVSHIFEIRNTGEAPLHIEKVETSLPGITTRFRPEILPGDFVPIEVEWNTTGFSGEMEAAMIVYTDDPKRPQTALHLTATIKPPIEFVPFPAVFFMAYHDEAPEKHVRIVNHEVNSLELDRIEFPENHYTVQLKTIRTGQEFELVVKVRPGVPFGRYTEPIYISTNLADRPRLQIQANLFVKPELYAFPEDIDFGALRLSELNHNPKLMRLLTQTTVVTSRARALEIVSVDTDLPYLRLAYETPEGVQLKSRISVDLVREALKTGPIQGAIVIHTSDPVHPMLEIPVHGEIR